MMYDRKTPELSARVNRLSANSTLPAFGRNSARQQASGGNATAAGGGCIHLSANGLRGRRTLRFTEHRLLDQQNQVGEQTC